MKLRAILAFVFIFLFLTAGVVLGADSTAGDVKVGGNLKIYFYDQSIGSHNDVGQQNNVSGGVNTLYLFLSQQLNDWLGIEVWPRISVSASATPSLGNDITRAKTSTTSVSVYQGYLTVKLPKEIELRAGKFLTYFSNEYGRQIWWDEQYHLNPGISSLQSWDDYGVELYRNFDFDKWSLPAYVYLLNGEKTDVDNNNSKAGMIHVDPEFFQGKLRLVGSYGLGKWDDNSDKSFSRYDAGFEWKWQRFNVRSEYLHRKYSDKLTSGAKVKDADDDGYFVKGLYRFNPQWRGLIGYSRSVNSSTYDYANVYKTTTLGLNFFISESSTIIGQFSSVDANRTNDSDKLYYNRYTVGWRTTF